MAKPKLSKNFARILFLAEQTLVETVVRLSIGPIKVHLDFKTWKFYTSRKTFVFKKVFWLGTQIFRPFVFWGLVFFHNFSAEGLGYWFGYLGSFHEKGLLGVARFESQTPKHQFYH